MLHSEIVNFIHHVCRRKEDTIVNCEPVIVMVIVTKESLRSIVIQYALADTVREWQRESFLKKNFRKEVASRGAHDKQHM